MTFSRFPASQRSRIGTSLLCVFLLFTGTATAQHQLSDEPFTVFVAKENAFARCGPAEDYYRTDQLRHGQQLDVYLETEDGWLGVRPPANSFCWIPAAAVEMSGNGETATVIEDRTVSWIGTHLGRARKYRWQVQLAAGEQVTVLGRSQRDGPDGPQTWFRIVPPSGEFRWVHRDQVVESAEALVASLRPAPSEELSVEELPSDQKRPGGIRSAIAQTANSIQQNLIKSPAATSSRRRPEGNRPSKRSLAVVDETPQLQAAPSPNNTPSQKIANTPDVAATTVGSGLRENWTANGSRDSLTAASTDAAYQPVDEIPEPIDETSDASFAASTEFIGRPRITDIGTQASAPQNNVAAADSNWAISTERFASPTTEQQAVRPATFLQQDARPAKTRTIAAERIAEVEREVRDADANQLQLLLSRLMAKGASAAETEPIVSRARNLSMTSRDQVTAGRARLLTERAEQYQRVARRRDGNTVIRERGIPAIPAGGGAASHGKSSTAMSADRQAETASGFLVQVYSSRANSPPFALTDHAGNTVSYVTPSPGINLRGHLNSHIKVVGRRGFLQGLNMPHILATQAARTPE